MAEPRNQADLTDRRDEARGGAGGHTGAAAGRRDPADAGAAFAELMAGLDEADDLTGAIQQDLRTKPETDDQTVRPLRRARAMRQPVTGDSAVDPMTHVPSLAELTGGLGMSDAEIAVFDQALTRTGTPRSPAEADGVSPAAPTPPARPVNSDPMVMNLVSVGMPESMAAEIAGGDTYAGVLSVLAHRPAPPPVPDAPGEILVLAGDLADIMPIGKRMAQQIGLDQSNLLLAGSTADSGPHSSAVLHTPAQAAARAQQLQSADAAWIVLLDAPFGGTDPIWVDDICDALGATTIWAVVDATRKTADTARYLRTLGGVEALVVHNVELTADPATLLGLDLPIVSLDGRPATPHAWAAMLCARIAADVALTAAAPRRRLPPSAPRV